MPRLPDVIVLLTDQDGTHASAAFTCQPVCGPVRSCLQTGRYATDTRGFRNDISLPRSTRTLAHHFRDGGYVTDYIGKWHLAPGDRADPVALEYQGGYEHWLAARTIATNTPHRRGTPTHWLAWAGSRPT